MMLFDAKNFYFNYPFLFGNDDYIFKKNGSEYDIHQLGLNSKHVVGELVLNHYKNGTTKGIFLRQQHMMS